MCIIVLKLLLITVLILLLAMMLLSVRVLLKKNGRFRSMHISDSKAMRDRGIGCVQSQDRQARRSNPKRIDVSKL